MVWRSFDWEGLTRTVQSVSDNWVGFDPERLVSDPDNILLADDEGNYALFEYEDEGVYSGHYMFAARGFKTIRIAREFLRFFLTKYPVDVIIGYTPVENKGALQLNKKLGFTFHDIVDTETGLHHRVSLQKGDFNYE